MTTKSVCPFCQTENATGVRVCSGPNCGAEILYGASNRELFSSFQQTFSLTLVVSFLLLVIGPLLLNAQLDANFTLLFGVGFYGIIAVVVFAFWLGFRARASAYANLAGQVRYFRVMQNQ